MKLLRFLIVIFFLQQSLPAFCWGFWAHKRINRIAVFLLPPGMIDFYKTNIEYVTEHAVDPDKRRYAMADEAPRHYIDLDHFCVYPCDSFPRKWNDAVAKYSEDTLKAYGIVPWHIQTMMYRLTAAFRMRDKERILKASSDIGHYIGDATVPLHTTENYNGQLTDQLGIHGFWESRIPELFAEDYDYFIGKADFVNKPLDYTWKVVLQSHAALDTVLKFEKELSKTFPEDQKYVFESRGRSMVRFYSESYSKAYSKMMQGMVERRMRIAIKMVADFWYTAWMNAGQPNLNQTVFALPTPEELKEKDEEEKAWKTKGKPMHGHYHPETGTE